MRNATRLSVAAPEKIDCVVKKSHSSVAKLFLLSRTEMNSVTMDIMLCLPHKIRLIISAINLGSLRSEWACFPIRSDAPHLHLPGCGVFY